MIKIEPERLERAARDEIISVLEDSFHDDPAPAFFLGPRRKEAHIKQLFEFIVDQAFLLEDQLDGIRVDGHLVACSLLENPGRFRTLGLHRAALFIAKVLKAWLTLPPGSLRRMNSYFNLARSNVPEGRWHYLTMLGVKKKYQGRGLGAFLLQMKLESVAQDAASKGMALDTENENNVAWYEKLGFELSHSKTLADPQHKTGLPIYNLVHHNDAAPVASKRRAI